MNYKNKIDWSVLSISGGLLVIFVLFSIFNSEFINNLVDVDFNFSVKYFGSFWQILMLGTFLIALFIAFSRFGDIKLGNLDKPEMNRFRWISIIMCTLLAGGGVFWAAAEPIYHFIAPPPLFTNITASTKEAIYPALSQSFMHWVFLAWAILGTLSSIILMYGHYTKKMPKNG